MSFSSFCVELLDPGKEKTIIYVKLLKEYGPWLSYRVLLKSKRLLFYK